MDRTVSFSFFTVPSTVPRVWAVTVMTVEVEELIATGA